MVDSQVQSIVNTILSVREAIKSGGSTTSSVDIVANTAGLATGADIANVVSALSDLPNIELNTDNINLNVQDLEALVQVANTLLNDLKAELQLKANLTDTQPVSIQNTPTVNLGSVGGVALESTLQDVLTVSTVVETNTTDIATKLVDGTQVSKIKDTTGNELAVNANGSINVTEVPVVNTITSTSVTSGGTVPSGNKSVSFTTSAGFVGTINGVSRDAGFIYKFSGNTLPAIPYTVTGGSIIIDRI